MVEIEPNKVQVGEVEIWRNRPFEIWHFPFIDDEVVKHGCPDGNCPHNDHWDLTTRYDPAAISLIENLPSGQKLLFQSDYCDTNHVAYATFRSLTKFNDFWRVDFQEKSSKPYYFTPSQQGSRFDTFWSSIPYAAVINSDAPAFGKYGGKPLFMRSVADLGGLPMKEVKEAVEELDSLNPPKPLRIKPAHRQARMVMDGLDQGDGKALTDDLEYYSSFRRGTHVLVDFITAATQQGRLEELEALTAGWSPSDPEPLRAGLDNYSNWISSTVPESQTEIASWREQWTTVFKLNTAS